MFEGVQWKPLVSEYIIAFDANRRADCSASISHAAYEYIILAAEQNIKLRFQNDQLQVLHKSHV